jgi:hypothetical protein
MSNTETPPEEVDEMAYALGNLAIATIEKARTIVQLDNWMAKNVAALKSLPPDISGAVRYAASKQRVKLGGGALPMGWYEPVKEMKK